MDFGLVIFLCFWAAAVNSKAEELKLEADEPFQRVPVAHEATVLCCYRWKETPTVTWIMRNISEYSIVNSTDSKSVNETKGVKCHSLFFKSTKITDTGFYQCELNRDTFKIFTHGTFLQVYKPLQKSLNLSESAKNSIITAEGVLLLLCVLIPGTMLLCKSKALNELNKKKGREEENIYEGLNLDDCNSAYHQIQRSNQQGPYQDVAICGEDIQLEKP